MKDNDSARIPLSGVGRSLIVHKDGTIESEYYDWDTVIRRELKQRLDYRGYKTTCITENHKTRTFLIHRLIAECFIPNPENKPQINHVNGIKTDNRLSNLEWCTGKENIAHAWANGLFNRNARAKPIIRKSRATGEIVRYCSANEAERQTGLSDTAIGNYCRGTRKQPKDYIWSFAE